MARELFNLLPSSANFSNNGVPMECFKEHAQPSDEQPQLKDVVDCSQRFASLSPLKDDTVSWDKISDEETRRLEEATNSVVKLLMEMRHAICRVKEMKQIVKDKNDEHIHMSRKMFATLRKAIDEREEQTIADVMEETHKKQKALELQLEKLVLLWTQIKNCLELMTNVNNTKMRSEEFTRRRIILEERSNHLREIKNKSRLKPVVGELAEPKFENMEQLYQAVSKLGYIPLDPSKCTASIPPVMVKRKTTLKIMLRNKYDKPITLSSEEVKVLVERSEGDEVIQGEIEGICEGKYEASFTPSRCGFYLISITVNGHHIQCSPYK